MCVCVSILFYSKSKVVVYTFVNIFHFYRRSDEATHIESISLASDDLLPMGI